MRLIPVVENHRLYDSTPTGVFLCHEGWGTFIIK